MLLKQLVEINKANELKEAHPMAHKKAGPMDIPDYKQMLRDMIAHGKITVDGALAMCLAAFTGTEVRDMLEKEGLLDLEDQHQDDEEPEEVEMSQDDEEPEEVEEDYAAAHEWDSDQQKIEQALTTALSIARSADWSKYVQHASKFFDTPAEKMAADAYKKLYDAVAAYRELGHAMSEIK